MIKAVISMLMLMLLTGCTSKEEKALLKVYKKQKNYHKKLLKTEKLQLKENNLTKVLLTATYMYTSENKRSDEVFIVGFYAQESDEQDFIHGEFSLRLDGKKPKSIQPIKREDSLLKYISFRASWSSFYLVHFPHTSKKTFRLILSSNTFGKGTLYFAKSLKYIFTKKSF